MTTQLTENGVSAKAIVTRLAHADTTITHNTEKLQEEAGGKFRQNSADKI